MEVASNRLVQRSAKLIGRLTGLEVKWRRSVTPFSLLRFAKNIYSQRGDDGIIQYIFDRLNV
jgi:hypothetical protein